ncbi:flavin reductase (DIM6/NTAB) family NADH-FMN oxidoreductase RutF [Microvirga flocculans]|uniref:Flavin reductase (DIM6/NTAB) family NADH-FMN oxidoreductase RutF n=1 Tax=Microvirga flocculans TaxID=217168 RepID=A0A7W6IFM0_9HYPH|nr:flavin reductase family protein [Microvirga flocculans]MBB4039985.1 flavin reductase (DIM6/NTAB) family NADH-FMN oxidoreductase RutF [Microvirga flocculans]
MFYETSTNAHGLPHDPFKAIVTPRPIGWISAMSAKGEVNLSPYSFFNAVSERPPMVAFSSAGKKDALTFIEETGEFVCNLATYDLREKMNLTSAVLPRGENEMKHAGLEPAPSRLVKPPRVAESPAALECKWLQTVPLIPLGGGEPSYYLVIGQVVGIHIDDRYIVNGLVDTAAMRPIARSGYRDYFVATPETKFSITRPGS